MKTKKVFKQKKVKPTRVIFFSNGPTQPTGYAKVIREITKRLSKDPGFEVAIIDELYYGNEPQQWNGIQVFGLPLPMRTGPSGNPEPARERTAEAFMNVLNQLDADIVVFLEDSFTLHNFGFEGVIKIGPKRVFYIPMDGDWIPETGINVIRTMDKLVSMAKFTQGVLKKEGFESDVIWHGVDLDLFSPISDEHQAALKKKYGFEPTDFVIYNYGRNSNIRKNNQGMLWIMAKYLSEAPENHKFLFHTLDAAFPGNSLVDYMNRHLTIEFGEEPLDRIRFTNFTHQKPATDQEVAEMMQMSDLVITASTGEGFGLIMAEAMACAKPIISTDYTTPKELLMDDVGGIGARGWTVPISAEFVAGLNTAHAYVDKDEFVRTIKRVVKNPKEMRQRAYNGRYFAEKYLNWDYLVEKWKTILDSIL